ncbi:transposase [Pedobacter sp. MC2016-24]|uniref:transposase n=1 Tax=Pedobacter sp. MC2016-24 TaxID=2780090 RepID=UPI001880249A|nr:transposase [Pedobacter sp. MC2016-24]MBE9598452.1 transposase [Pedobacter sp. MC2016-24]
MVHIAEVTFSLGNGSFEMIGGDKVVEIDESYVGGKNANRHVRKRVSNSQGRSTKDKAAVLGILERGGNVKVTMLEKANGEVVNPIINETVKLNSQVMTDEWKVYRKLKLSTAPAFLSLLIFVSL